MRRLDRYIGGTVLAAIGLVLVVIVGLDALTAFIDEAEDIRETYTSRDVLVYVALTLPRRLYDYVPFAAMIGCLVGLGQLASSSELIVMRSAGVSVARLVWIAMKPALMVAVAGFLIGEYVAPKTEQMAQSRRAMAMNPGEGVVGFYGLWNREGDTFLHFNALEPPATVHGVTLLQFDERQQLQSALRAQRAIYRGEFWSMEQVVKTDFSSWQTTRTRLDTLRWNTGITPELLTMEVVAPDNLPLVDLYRYSLYLAQQGLNADDFELSLWKKLLQPLTVAGLVLVGISFIFGPLREGTMGFRIFAGVIVGITFRTSQDLLGPASLVFGFAPIYAALVPIVICMLFGFGLLSRTN